MKEKQYEELLEKLNIGKNRSNAEIKELLSIKLEEYLDREDEAALQMQSDIQDAMDYVEELIDKMGSGIALPSKETEESKEEINRELLEQAAKDDKKGTGLYTLGSAVGGQNGSINAGNGLQGMTTSVSGVNPKGKPWFYSMYGDQKVDSMFDMAEGGLQMGDFKHAVSVFDTILKNEMTNAGAYMGKVLAKYKLQEPKDIATCYVNGLENDGDLKRAENCGNPKQKKFIQDALEERRKAMIYIEADKVLQISTNSAKLLQAAADFDSISMYRDASKKADDCRKAADNAKKEEDKQKKEAEKKQKEENARREKERKKRERKQSIENIGKAVKGIAKLAIVVAVLVVVGSFFYNRYMSPTYYGTTFYLGTLFDYKEYVIADSVEVIPEELFMGVDMESVVISESVYSIESGAFKDCASLKHVTMPSSVWFIREEAFYNCDSLQSIALPRSIDVIERRAFGNCDSLQSVKAPKLIGLAEIFEGSPVQDITYY